MTVQTTFVCPFAMQVISKMLLTGEEGGREGGGGQGRQENWPQNSFTSLHFGFVNPLQVVAFNQCLHCRLSNAFLFQVVPSFFAILFVFYVQSAHMFTPRHSHNKG